MLNPVCFGVGVKGVITMLGEQFHWSWRMLQHLGQICSSLDLWPPDHHEIPQSTRRVLELQQRKLKITQRNWVLEMTNQCIFETLGHLEISHPVLFPPESFRPWTRSMLDFLEIALLFLWFLLSFVQNEVKPPTASQKPSKEPSCLANPAPQRIGSSWQGWTYQNAQGPARGPGTRLVGEKSPFSCLHRLATMSVPNFLDHLSFLRLEPPHLSVFCPLCRIYLQCFLAFFSPIWICLKMGQPKIQLNCQRVSH
jgi:hypothetical protein